MKQVLGVVLLCLIAACVGEEKKKEQIATRQKSDTPMGAWFMYAGSETGIRGEDDLDREITILVLSDSTYSLTVQEPHIQRNFVEKGQVVYDMRNGQIKFTVHTSTGVDFSGTEPRKLVDVDPLVPWQRDPGTEYVMMWRLEQQGDESGENMRDVMVLSAEGHEASYFARLRENREGSAVLDAQMKSGDK